MTKKRERIYLLIAYAVVALSTIFIGYDSGNLSIAQSIAVCLFAVGLGVWVRWLLLGHRKESSDE